MTRGGARLQAPRVSAMRAARRRFAPIFVREARPPTRASARAGVNAGGVFRVSRTRRATRDAHAKKIPIPVDSF